MPQKDAKYYSQQNYYDGKRYQTWSNNWIRLSESKFFSIWSII